MSAWRFESPGAGVIEVCEMTCGNELMFSARAADDYWDNSSALALIFKSNTKSKQQMRHKLLSFYRLFIFTISIYFDVDPSSYI